MFAGALASLWGCGWTGWAGFYAAYGKIFSVHQAPWINEYLILFENPVPEIKPDEGKYHRGTRIIRRLANYSYGRGNATFHTNCFWEASVCSAFRWIKFFVPSVEKLDETICEKWYYDGWFVTIFFFLAVLIQIFSVQTCLTCIQKIYHGFCNRYIDSCVKALANAYFTSAGIYLWRISIWCVICRYTGV